MDLLIKIIYSLIPLFIMLPGLLFLYMVYREMQNSQYGFCLNLLNDGNPSSGLEYVRKIKIELDKIEDGDELILLKVEANRQQAIHTDFSPMTQFFVLYVLIIGAVVTFLEYIGGDTLMWLTSNYSKELWASGVMILMSFLVCGTLLISNFRINRADAEVLKELIDLRIKEINVS